ncbi:hypothetical protein DL95DRAFT_138552 [Leptodontidium sp. 2 PMI_412]|nr:hypothetical protein DL95DRAFT_138552 [Leptodontidium sp. 2 PMI_412]
MAKSEVEFKSAVEIGSSNYKDPIPVLSNLCLTQWQPVTEAHQETYLLQTVFQCQTSPYGWACCMCPSQSINAIEYQTCYKCSHEICRLCELFYNSFQFNYTNLAWSYEKL